MMTPHEHKLMIGVFAKTIHNFMTLIAVLQSRGVLEKDDIEAYHALLLEDVKLTDEVIDHAKLIYRHMAVGMGIDVPEDIL